MTSTKEKKLRIPVELRQQSLGNHFYSCSKTVRYADRLVEAGFRRFEDLEGLSANQIRRKVRTTDVTWKYFVWALAEYGAKFED